MNILTKLNGSELLIELEGSLNSNTAPELYEVVEKSLSGLTSLIFDFKKVDYVSSAGLRVLLMACKAMKKQGTMVVRNVNKEIMDIFTMTGFDEILDIEN